MYRCVNFMYSSRNKVYTTGCVENVYNFCRVYHTGYVVKLSPNMKASNGFFTDRLFCLYSDQQLV